ncbi:hypothetical protein KTE19_08295 [Lentilactobacillus sp. IMAU92037]|uniref:hypothetical protein n=1 Tax=Lentilactobacillus TaxID=2767893 RepID=UPI001C26AFCE|nr:MULTISPECIES: hypothetical protein [Lentilactobacillus]MBU9789442.1 hypothetical protein [Lentilactobacillus dabitei]MBV0930712.1 hypothetical protein [Lentilactobacillus dabitei]MDM7516459.1 hypothetical protein [Lentilactobacillus sp. TOM.63]
MTNKTKKLIEFKHADDEKARVDLVRSVYNSDVPILSDPQTIKNYLSENQEKS